MIALGLLNEHFDRTWLEKLEPDVRDAELLKIRDRLDLARELAVGVLAERIAAWEPPIILGTTTMLGAVRRAGAVGLLETRPTWERELRAAAKRAPGKAEPVRFLTGAYLGIWASLSDKEQRQLEPLITKGLRSQDTFSLFAELWMQVAADRKRAMSAIPDRPWAWRHLQATYARNADWNGFVEAWNWWDDALLAELERELEDVSRRFAGGDPRQARSVLLSIAGRARPDRRYAGVLSRALERCPPGAALPHWVERLSVTLDWVLEQCVRSSCPITPEALERLAGAVGELPAPKEASVALLTGDERRARFLEQQFFASGNEAWAPYQLQKARVLAELGETTESLGTLSGLHRSWRGTALEMELRRTVAEMASDTQAVEAAHRKLQSLAVDRWSGTAWRWRGRNATLEILVVEPANGIMVDVDVAPPRGSPVELRLDGEVARIAVAYDGEPVTLQRSLNPGVHFLEVAPLTGRRVAPGMLRLTR